MAFEPIHTDEQEEGLFVIAVMVSVRYDMTWLSAEFRIGHRYFAASKMEWKYLPPEPEHYEVREPENVNLEVKELYDFEPDLRTFLERRPHGDREGCAVGFIHDAVDDSGAEE